MNDEGSPSPAELVRLLRRGTDHLINMAKGMEIAWDPTSDDPRRVHNMYVRNLVTSYVNRFSELSNGVLIHRGIGKNADDCADIYLCCCRHAGAPNPAHTASMTTDWESPLVPNRAGDSPEWPRCHCMPFAVRTAVATRELPTGFPRRRLPARRRS